MDRLLGAFLGRQWGIEPRNGQHARHRCAARASSSNEAVGSSPSSRARNQIASRRGRRVGFAAKDMLGKTPGHIEAIPPDERTAVIADFRDHRGDAPGTSSGRCITIPQLRAAAHGDRDPEAAITQVRTPPRSINGRRGAPAARKVYLVSEPPRPRRSAWAFPITEPTACMNLRQSAAGNDRGRRDLARRHRQVASRSRIAGGRVATRPSSPTCARSTTCSIGEQSAERHQGRHRLRVSAPARR